MESSTEKEKILVIDDEIEFCEAFKEFLEEEGYAVQARSNPVEALKILDRFLPDCVVLDLHMPHMNGVEALKRIKTKQADTPVIISSAHDNVKLVEECMRLGATGYVTKPVDLDHFLKEIQFALNQNQIMREKRASAQHEFQKNAASIQHEILQKIEATLHFLELTEPDLVSHSRNVAWLCKKLGEKLVPGHVDLCEFAGWFHDLGKLRFPKDIRTTPFKNLTPNEQQSFRNYPIHGQDLVETVFSFEEAANVIRHQNENFDGAGFPDGWEGESIPLESRILAVANAFVEEYEEMGLPDFNLALENGKTLLLKLIQQEPGRFDPHVVNTLMDFINEHKYSSLREKDVTLDQLRSGMVLSRNLTTESGIFIFSENTTLTDRRIQIIKDFTLIDPLPPWVSIFYTP